MRGVQAALSALLLLATPGCFYSEETFGGDRVLQGFVDEAEDLGRVDPGAPYFPGWTARLHVATNETNRGVPRASPCYAVFLDVNSRSQPDAYDGLSALADQQGRASGGYIEFRALTFYHDSLRESMRITELISVVPGPAGEEWAGANCETPPDFYTHGD